MATSTPGAAETDIEAAQVANTTGVTPEGIQSTLREKLEAQVVEVEDISGISLSTSTFSMSCWVEYMLMRCIF